MDERGRQLNTIDTVLQWVREAVQEAPASHNLWLDAATGAGNMTVKLASILAGQGDLVTVDRDEESERNAHGRSSSRKA